MMTFIVSLACLARALRRRLTGVRATDGCFLPMIDSEYKCCMLSWANFRWIFYILHSYCDEISGILGSSANVASAESP